MKTELHNLLIATSRLRLRIQERAPTLTGFSDWELSTKAMREAEAALTRATAPAPASGWMERDTDGDAITPFLESAMKAAAEAHDTDAPRTAFDADIEYRRSRGVFVATFVQGVKWAARHAPDVAKLEETIEIQRLGLKAWWEYMEHAFELTKDQLGSGAEVAERIKALMESNAKLEAEVAELKGNLADALQKYQRENTRKQSMIDETKAKVPEAALASSELVAKSLQIEAENARLREALKGIHREMKDGHGNRKWAAETAEQALAASPAPSAWREMERDKARLDWLESQNVSTIYYDGDGSEEESDGEHFLEPKTTLRAAIDFAMTKPLPEPPAREEQ